MYSERSESEAGSSASPASAHASASTSRVVYPTAGQKPEHSRRERLRGGARGKKAAGGPLAAGVVSPAVGPTASRTPSAPPPNRQPRAPQQPPPHTQSSPASEHAQLTSTSTSRWAAAPPQLRSPASTSRELHPARPLQGKASSTPSLSSPRLDGSALAAPSAAVDQIDAMLARLRTPSAGAERPQITTSPVSGAPTKSQPPLGGRSRWDTAGLAEDARRAAEEAQAQVQAQAREVAETVAAASSPLAMNAPGPMGDMGVELAVSAPASVLVATVPPEVLSPTPVSPPEPQPELPEPISLPLSPLTATLDISTVLPVQRATSPSPTRTSPPVPAPATLASGTQDCNPTSPDISITSLGSGAPPNPTSSVADVAAPAPEPVKHIDWADDELDDELPALDDWMVTPGGSSSPDLSRRRSSGGSRHSAPTSPDPSASFQPPTGSRHSVPADAGYARFGSSLRDPLPHASSTPPRGARRGKAGSPSTPQGPAHAPAPVQTPRGGARGRGRGRGRGGSGASGDGGRAGVGHGPASATASPAASGALFARLSGLGSRGRAATPQKAT